MHLTRLPDDDGLVRVQCSGKILQYLLQPGTHPLEKAVGPEVFKYRVLFDLSATEFIDTSGIAWMLGCHKRFNAYGGRIVFHSAPPIVDQPLSVLNMDKVLLLALDEPQARRMANAAEEAEARRIMKEGRP
jgi:anti-anti-sigma regulatory factor